VIKLDDKRRRHFGPGAKVRVRREVMVGFGGIVASMSGADRVKVLFEMMGRKTSVTLREAEITAA